MPEPALLESAVRRTGAPLCVGIDPVRDRLPAGDDLQVIQDFGLRIVDQLADLVPAVKIQSAVTNDLAQTASRCATNWPCMPAKLA